MQTVAQGQETIQRILLAYAPHLANCREAVRRELADAPLGTVLSDYVEGGKMLRALLVFLSASALGGDPEDAMPGAAAIELLHGAALVHDDIIDDACTRRGKAALHVALGTGRALVLGDYLILRSIETVARARSPRALEAVALLSRYAQECCRGQIEDLDAILGNPEQSYLSIIRGKTAAPFVAAVTLGGLLVQTSLGGLDVLCTYALNLGMAFQIHDDHLDLKGDETDMGKPVGQSLANGRPLLHLIYLERYGSPAAVRSYRQLCSGGLPRRALVEILEQERIFERVSDVAARYRDVAVESLHALESSRHIDELTAMAYYVTSRST